MLDESGISRIVQGPAVATQASGPPLVPKEALNDPFLPPKSHPEVPKNPVGGACLLRSESKDRADRQGPGLPGQREASFGAAP